MNSNNNNRVQLTGNLGKDPEIRQFDSGKLATFSLATREDYWTKAGEQASQTQWHRISAWGKVAERIEAELKKGTFVSIEGRLRNRSYTDKDGAKKFVTEIIATDIHVNKAA